MNNNQFKRFIRETVESCCEENDLITIYIDTSSNSRIFYVYDKKYQVRGTIDSWLGNKEFTFRISFDKEKVVSLTNNDCGVHGNYMELDKLIDYLDRQIFNMSKNTGEDNV